MPDTVASAGPPHPYAALDSAHVGAINGAFGTIAEDDTRPRATWGAKLKTLAAIVGPGLIVMVGDNDAGAFGTYTQAGQNYGTALLWTLLMLVPVLYVNQEMVLRLGAVTGVGHARLILERFGKFWGAFSVIDLFILNGLTIVTEFIGVSLGLDALGLPKLWGVLAAAAVTMAAATTGNLRRFERFSIFLCFGSLLLVPVFLAVHPPLGEVAHDFVTPQLPAADKLSDVLLLIIAIVGTTVAPWQLFFQQSNVIDKRLTPRWMAYERADTWIGAFVVILGAAALMIVTAFAFAGTKLAGQFGDAGTAAAGLAHALSPVAGAMFALVLLNASLIGAAAVTLSTSYAFGDVFGIKHSLHRSWKDARGFYAIYAALVALAAAIVLIPNAPLGLITTAVQALAGVLLPSASVFLLLLCNDRAVLGPWVNKPWLNAMTSAIVGVLVMLSLILAATTLFPSVDVRLLTVVLAAILVVGLVVTGLLYLRRPASTPIAAVAEADRLTWRMPPLGALPKPAWSTVQTVGMVTLRGYLLVAAILLAVKVVGLALGH